MNKNLRLGVAVLLASALFYSSCTKETKSKLPADNTAIGVSLAMSLYQSLNGTAGSSTSITGQVGTSSTNKLQVNSFTCGQTIDFPVDYSIAQGDSVKATLKGNGHMVINCENNQVNGYTLTYVTSNVGFNPYQSYDKQITEQYTVKSLAAAYTKMEVNGSQISVIKTQQKKNPSESSTQTNRFNMKGFIIDSTTSPSDITAGTATFTSEGTNDGRAFSFTGIITFLGNHKAEVAFDGKVVSVDLLTGKTTLK